MCLEKKNLTKCKKAFTKISSSNKCGTQITAKKNLINVLFCFQFNISFLIERYNLAFLKSNRMSICVSVCVFYRKIALTAEPIWFSLTMKLLICLGKIYNSFWGGYLHPCL